MTKHYVKPDGVTWWGGKDVPPPGGIEVPLGPSDARMLWNGSAWEMPINMALSDVKAAIDEAMYTRINQGIKWGWSAEEPEHSIKLEAGLREMLAGWHQLLNKTAPPTQPHNGFIKSNGVIIRGPGDIDLPDVAINEIAEFAGLWVPKISQIAIAQKLLAATMDLTALQAYDDSTIDWSIRDETIAGMTLTDWPVEKTDWIDDLCLYNP